MNNGPYHAHIGTNGWDIRNASTQIVETGYANEAAAINRANALNDGSATLKEKPLPPPVVKKPAAKKAAAKKSAAPKKGGKK